jgi:hypothetical protein
MEAVHKQKAEKVRAAVRRAAGLASQAFGRAGELHAVGHYFMPGCCRSRAGPHHPHSNPHPNPIPRPCRTPCNPPAPDPREEHRGPAGGPPRQEQGQPRAQGRAARGAPRCWRARRGGRQARGGRARGGRAGQGGKGQQEVSWAAARATVCNRPHLNALAAPCACVSTSVAALSAVWLQQGRGESVSGQAGNPSGQEHTHEGPGLSRKSAAWHNS